MESDALAAHTGGSKVSEEGKRAAADIAARLKELTEQRDRLATALVWFMDGTKDHDIQAETGLPNDDCDFIANTRAEAQQLLRRLSP